MGNNKPPQPAAQEAEYQQPAPDPFAWTGWLPGWTFSSQPASLLNPTSTSLGIRCLDEPGKFEVELPGYRETWKLGFTQQSTCRLLPEGVRLIEEGETEDTIVSIIKLDAATLIVEGDEKILGASLNPDAEWTKNDAHIVIQCDRQLLVYFLNRAGGKSTLVITTGMGEARGLITRARGNTATSAHQLMDQELSRRSSSAPNMSFAVTPTDWIISRLRAASPLLTYPWLADGDDEPLWRLPVLFPAFLVLLNEYPDIAAGLLGNVIEGINHEGKLPVGGGHASPLFYDFTETPLLIQMVMGHMRHTGKWPMEISRLVPLLETYFFATGDYLTETGQQNDRLTSVLWTRERDAWDMFLHQSGHVPQKRPKATQTNDPVMMPKDTGCVESLLQLVDPAIPDEQKILAVAEFNREAHPASALLTSQNLEIIFFILQGSEEWEPGAHAAWMKSLRPTLAKLWRNTEINLLSHGASRDEIEPLLLASMCAWTASAKQAEYSQQQRLSGWFERHRRMLTGFTLALVIGLVGFIITVQLRSSMPSTVYETQMGLALQEYNTGQYGGAIEKLLAIEARGHQKNPYNLFLLGKAYYHNRQYAEAALIFERVAAVRPENPSAMYNLGLSLFRAGRPNEAITAFDHVRGQFARTHPLVAARAAKAVEIVKAQSTLKFNPVAGGIK